MGLLRFPDRRAQFRNYSYHRGGGALTATVVLGLAWGDEGKGRVCDALASDVGYVSRYSGGNNAGHTVRVGEEEFKLHLVPFRHRARGRGVHHRQRGRGQPRGARRGGRGAGGAGPRVSGTVSRWTGGRT